MAGIVIRVMLARVGRYGAVRPMSIDWLVILAACVVGKLVFLLARRLGLPSWENWRAGDAFDFAVLAAILTFVLLRIVIKLARP